MTFLRGFDATKNCLLGEREEGSKEEVQRQPKDVREGNAWKTHGETKCKDLQTDFV